MFSPRKLIAFICLAAVLAAAIAPGVSPMLWALVVPLLLFALLEVVAVEPATESDGLPSLFFCSLLSSRAPPLA